MSDTMGPPGGIQFPWSLLSRPPWFHLLHAANPRTYASEGLRGALVPAIPHIPAPWSLLALAAITLGAGTWGVRDFRRRALD